MRTHYLVALGLSLSAPLAYASSTTDSSICMPHPSLLQGKNIQLPKGAQQLFGFNNLTKQTLEFRSINTTGTAQAGWDSTLKPGNWSVLALNSKPLTLSCYQNNKQQSCADVIKLCQFYRADFSDKAKGSYWVAENSKPDQLIQKIAERNIDADG